MSKTTTRQERLNKNQPENNEQEQQQQAAAETAAPAAAGKQFGEHDSPEDLDFNQPFQNMNFDELEGREGQELTADFLSLETINDNLPHNYFVTGMTTFTDNQTGETKPAVSLIGKGNVSLICGAKTVVTACEKLTSFPVPIRIIVNGKTKGKNGSYWNAKVLSL